MARPTVTYALMCYRHEPFVERAVQSALRQTGDPIEILISDDASDDRTFELVERAVAGYAGPHRVRLNRNDANMGMAHFNRLLELAEGDYLVIAHGDDYSHTERAATLMDIFLREGVTMISSNCRVMDRSGRSMGRISSQPAHRMTVATLIDKGWQDTMLGSTHAFHRDLLARFDGVDPEWLPISYDLAFPFRGALLDGAYYCDKELVAWRRHGRNTTDMILRRNASRAEQTEGAFGVQVTELFGMMRDIATLMRRDGGNSRLRRIHQALREKTLSSTELWIGSRNVLVGQGLLPAWQTRDSMAVDPEAADYSGRETSWLIRALRNRSD